MHRAGRFACPVCLHPASRGGDRSGLGNCTHGRNDFRLPIERNPASSCREDSRLEKIIGNTQALHSFVGELFSFCPSSNVTACLQILRHPPHDPEEIANHARSTCQNSRKRGQEGKECWYGKDTCAGPASRAKRMTA